MFDKRKAYSFQQKISNNIESVKQLKSKSKLLQCQMFKCKIIEIIILFNCLDGSCT